METINTENQVRGFKNAHSNVFYYPLWENIKDNLFQFENLKKETKKRINFFDLGKEFFNWVNSIAKLNTMLIEFRELNNISWKNTNPFLDSNVESMISLIPSEKKKKMKNPYYKKFLLLKEQIESQNNSLIVLDRLFESNPIIRTSYIGKTHICIEETIKILRRKATNNTKYKTFFLEMEQKSFHQKYPIINFFYAHCLYAAVDEFKFEHKLKEIKKDKTSKLLLKEIIDNFSSISALFDYFFIQTDGIASSVNLREISFKYLLFFWKSLFEIAYTKFDDNLKKALTITWNVEEDWQLFTKELLDISGDIRTLFSIDEPTTLEKLSLKFKEDVDNDIIQSEAVVCHFKQEDSINKLYEDFLVLNKRFNIQENKFSFKEYGLFLKETPTKEEINNFYTTITTKSISDFFENILHLFCELKRSKIKNVSSKIDFYIQQKVKVNENFHKETNKELTKLSSYLDILFTILKKELTNKQIAWLQEIYYLCSVVWTEIFWDYHKNFTHFLLILFLTCDKPDFEELLTGELKFDMRTKKLSFYKWTRELSYSAKKLLGKYRKYALFMKRKSFKYKLKDYYGYLVAISNERNWVYKKEISDVEYKISKKYFDSTKFLKGNLHKEIETEIILNWVTLSLTNLKFILARDVDAREVEEYIALTFRAWRKVNYSFLNLLTLLTGKVYWTIVNSTLPTLNSFDIQYSVKNPEFSKRAKISDYNGEDIWLYGCYNYAIPNDEILLEKLSKKDWYLAIVREKDHIFDENSKNEWRRNKYNNMVAEMLFVNFGAYFPLKDLKEKSLLLWHNDKEFNKYLLGKIDILWEDIKKMVNSVPKYKRLNLIDDNYLYTPKENTVNDAIYEIADDGFLDMIKKAIQISLLSEVNYKHDFFKTFVEQNKHFLSIYKKLLQTKKMDVYYPIRKEFPKNKKTLILLLNEREYKVNKDDSEDLRLCKKAIKKIFYLNKKNKFSKYTPIILSWREIWESEIDMNEIWNVFIFPQFCSFTNDTSKFVQQDIFSFYMQKLAIKFPEIVEKDVSLFHTFTGFQKWLYALPHEYWVTTEETFQMLSTKFSISSEDKFYEDRYTKKLYNRKLFDNDSKYESSKNIDENWLKNNWYDSVPTHLYSEETVCQFIPFFNNNTKSNLDKVFFVQETINKYLEGAILSELLKKIQHWKEWISLYSELLKKMQNWREWNSSLYENYIKDISNEIMEVSKISTLFEEHYTPIDLLWTITKKIDIIFNKQSRLHIINKCNEIKEIINELNSIGTP